MFLICNLACQLRIWIFDKASNSLKVFGAFCYLFEVIVVEGHSIRGRDRSYYCRIGGNTKIPNMIKF